MASLCVNNSFLLNKQTTRKLPFLPATRNRRRLVTIAAESSMATDKLGIKIEKNPPESTLTQLGVKNWPKYLSMFSFFLSANSYVYLVFDLEIGIYMFQFHILMDDIGGEFTGGVALQASSHGRTVTKRLAICWKEK